MLHACVTLTGLVVAFWIFKGARGAVIAVWGSLSRHAPYFLLSGWRGCCASNESQAYWNACAHGDGHPLWHGHSDVRVLRHVIFHTDLTPAFGLAQSKGNWWEFVYYLPLGLWIHFTRIYISNTTLLPPFSSPSNAGSSCRECRHDPTWTYPLTAQPGLHGLLWSTARLRYSSILLSSTSKLIEHKVQGTSVHMF